MKWISVRTLRTGDGPGLPGWAQCYHMILLREKQEGQCEMGRGCTAGVTRFTKELGHTWDSGTAQRSKALRHTAQAPHLCPGGAALTPLLLTGKSRQEGWAYSGFPGVCPADGDSVLVQNYSSVSQILLRFR